MSTPPKLALDFKSATLYALRAVLHSSDTDALASALDRRMAEAGAFYEGEPVVLDASGLQVSPDWAALAAALRRHTLHPIGVLAQGEVQTQALAAGLAPVELSGARPPAAAPASEPPPVAATPAAAVAPPTVQPAGTAGSPDRRPDAAEPAAAPAKVGADAGAGGTLVVRHPLRSGQRVYARGGDLIVIGMVSQGAEVIADGNIHVYGPLRGKAMAGARGNTEAMILTTQLDPELLAIAGIYRVVETRLPEDLHKRPAQIHLDGDTLRMRAL